MKLVIIIALFSYFCVSLTKTQFKFLYCFDNKSGNSTICYFYYELSYFEAYSLTFCLHPKKDFDIIKLYHVECDKRHKIFFIQTENLTNNKWNSLTLRIEPKNNTDATTFNYSYEIKNKWNSQSVVNEECAPHFPYVSLRLRIYGGWDGSRVFTMADKWNMTNCNPEANSSNETLNPECLSWNSGETVFIIGVILVVIGIGAAGASFVAVLKVRRARKLRREVSVERRRSRDGKPPNDLRLGSRGSSDVNPKLQPTSEYEDGRYEDGFDMKTIQHSSLLSRQ